METVSLKMLETSYYPITGYVTLKGFIEIEHS